MIAGELTKEQTELLFTHMPIGLGFSVADEEDVVVFWAGDGFSTCSPKLIGRTLYDCHPKRAHAAIESLLADLKSGKTDEVDTIEHGKNGAERIIYTALRDGDGAYRGVLETVVPIDEAGSAEDAGEAEAKATDTARERAGRDSGRLRGRGVTSTSPCSAPSSPPASTL